VVVDECQDLGVPEARLVAALAGSGPDRLFLTGDLGQRIFQQPFSWKAVGIDLRGRSFTLRVNYRTSHQIRECADRLLPAEVADVDGLVERRRGTVSLFDGPTPEIRLFATVRAEVEGVAARLRRARATESGAVFVRSERELPRAIEAVRAAGCNPWFLGDAAVPPGESIAVGTMHQAKGLEFRAVAVMACDESVLPSDERITGIGDDADLQEVYDTERHLLYVACTRARDNLLVSGVEPGSEFLADLE
jgi:superfamily I DNA/RNA helicase